MGERVKPPRASRVAMVVEVRADEGGRAPGGLVGAAYRASRQGTVVLVLNGLSAAQVDRALDSVVANVDGVAGVEYCTPATLEGLLQESGWPSVAFVDTGKIAAPLSRHGVRVLSPDSALDALDEWCAGAGSDTDFKGEN